MRERERDQGREKERLCFIDPKRDCATSLQPLTVNEERLFNEMIVRQVFDLDIGKFIYISKQPSQPLV